MDGLGMAFGKISSYPTRSAESFSVAVVSEKEARIRDASVSCRIALKGLLEDCAIKHDEFQRPQP
jgi:hypothetical protein